MNDEVIQHHFDEVFSALQDKENFEIFTKLKPANEPRIRKTIVNILSAQNEGMSERDSSKLGRNESFSQKENVANVISSYESRSSSKFGPPKKTSGLKVFLERDKTSEMRNTLFECKNCGRYILGDFLQVHEQSCGRESR
ncbi:hypothetical protein JTB14_008054 [Gonioctena quinquepunctata]|nr:hypothetical protein JTB14_008054 [Gonioctena quinquepunctata]